jgi:hypothetical protein
MSILLLVPLVAIAEDSGFASREGKLAVLKEFTGTKVIPDIQRATLYTPGDPTCGVNNGEEAKPVVFYHTGHLRTFWNGPDAASSLQESFCELPGFTFLNILITRQDSMLPSDAKSFVKWAECKSSDKKDPLCRKTLEIKPEPSIALLSKMNHVYCEPFFANVISDAYIKQSIPESLWSFFEEGHSGANTGGKKRNTMFRVLSRLNNVYLREAHVEGLKRFKEMYGYEMPANQIIVKDRPDCLFRMNILRLIPAMRALLGKQPNILFTQFHPVWTLNDMGWVTTRAIVDELLKIDFDCLVANERSYAPVPEHAFACGLHVASQTLSLRVFAIEGMEPPKASYHCEVCPPRFCASGEAESSACKSPPRCRKHNPPPPDNIVENVELLMRDELHLVGDRLSKRSGANQAWARWKHARLSLACTPKCVGR